MNILLIKRKGFLLYAFAKDEEAAAESVEVRARTTVGEIVIRRP